MNDFVKTTRKSVTKRKLVYGVGVNDATYNVTNKLNGKVSMCPVYSRWRCLLQRCYDKGSLARYPTYNGCCICSEWLVFSCFSRWFEENYIEGYQLDKDIKIDGNKIYSPETCLFVPKSVNLLLNTKVSGKAGLPEGVALVVKTGRYKGQIRIDGKRVHLGTFGKAIDAGEAYLMAKNAEITRKANMYPYLKRYLLNKLR